MDGRFQSFVSRLTGHPEATPLPHRLLNLFAFLGSFQAAYFLLSDSLVGQPLVFLGFDLAMLVFFSILYVEVRVKEKFRPGNHVFATAAVLLSQYNFYVNSGTHGPGLLVILAIGVAVNLVHPGRAGLAYTAAGAVLSLTALGIQEVHPDWVLGYHNSGSRSLDIALTFFLALFVLVIIIRMVTRFHEEVQDRSVRIQAAAAQSEQMASLGEMLAGLGHEIGTPVGVLSSCLSLSREWWTEELPRFRPVWEALNPEQRAAFWSFAGAGLAAPAGDRADSRSVRELRDRLFQSLEARGLADARFLAEDLAALEMTSWDPRWDPLTPPGPGRDAWGFLVKLLVLDRSNRLADRALERIQRLAGALGSYSRTGSIDDPPEPLQVSAGLDSVLTLYAAARKDRLEVVRDYDPVPPVLARADGLIQVWTNLVQNALQAMGGSDRKGTLTARIRHEGSWVLVAIEDTGPGVAPELREKVFQLFFTTKERGAGTGIGLAIARKVVLSHGGRLEVTSAPGGGARFEVRLPAL